MIEQRYYIADCGAPKQGASSALLASRPRMAGAAAIAGRLTNRISVTTTVAFVDPTTRRRPPLE